MSFLSNKIRLSNVKYRSRTEITAQILEVAIGGVNRTRIMYKGFLSYAQLKEYLQVLIENGLLTFDKGAEKFKTTDKGIRFLRIYQELEQLAPRPQEIERRKNK